MYKILMNVSSLTACGYYRALLPWAMCNGDLLREGILLEHSTSLDTRRADYDCYIFHRIMSDKIWPFVSILKRLGKTLVWDFDDNLFTIPEWSTARGLVNHHEREVMKWSIENSDYVSLTTDRFKDQFKDAPSWHSKIHVNPNLFYTGDWDLPSTKLDTGAIRFLWAGSNTHSGDLDIVAPAILRMIEKYGDQVQFIFMGLIPNSLRVTQGMSEIKSRLLQRSVTYINHCELQYYPQTLKTLIPDIALAPIEENQFNNAKSNIKFLEMTMAGAVVIASNVGPYKDSIEDGETGYLCENTEDDWFNKMEYVYSTFSDKTEIENYLIQEHVCNNYSWEGNRKNIWMNFFRMLAGKEVAKTS